MSEDDSNVQPVLTRELSPDELPSQQIVELVGEVSDTPAVPGAETNPDQILPPLHSAVDTDALDRLVNSGGDRPTAGTRIEFSYHGYMVTICTDRPTPAVRLERRDCRAKPCSPISADS